MSGALREILAVFDIDTSALDKAGKKSEGTIDGLKGAIAKAGAAIGGGLLAQGLKDMVLDLAEQGKQLEVTSTKLGINTTDLQAWQTAAELSGSSADSFNTALKKMQKNSADAAEAGAQTGGEFQKLGVFLREDAGGPMRDTQDILYDTGIAISKLKDPAERTQAAMKVFGKSGTDLIPMFAKGEEGLKDYLSQLDKLGGGIAEDAVPQLAKLKESTEKWEIATNSAKSKLVVAFLPGITKMVSTMTSAVVAFANNKSAMAQLQGGVEALGVAGAAAGVAFLAPWLPAITGFALLGLVVQDFIVGLRGGDSEIGHLIDQLFGEGKGQSFFVDVKKDAEEVLGVLKDIVNTIKQIKDLKGLGKETVSTLKEEGKKDEQRADSGSKGGYLTANDEAMRAGEDERRKSLIGPFKDAIAAMRNANSGASGAYYKAESVPTEEAERLIDKIQQAGIKLEDLGSGNTLEKAFNIQDAIGKALATTPGKEEKNVNVTQSNQTNVTITAPSGDASDIASSTGDAIGAANRATYDGIRRVVTP